MRNFAPPNADRWMVCDAVQFFEPDVDRSKDSKVRLEGLAADNLVTLGGDGYDLDEVVGAYDDNGTLFTPSMVDHIKHYLEFVAHSGGVRERSINSDLVNMSGRIDWYGIKDRTLEVVELKYGYRIVEPTTWQLIAGVYLLQHASPEFYERVDAIKLTVHQPRAMHIDGITRSITLTMDEFEVKCGEMLDRIDAICRADTPVARPGPHCVGCNMAMSCQALTQSIYQAYDVVESIHQINPTGEQLGVELDLLDKMEVLLKAKRTPTVAEGEARLAAGEYVPGWRIENRVGNNHFTVSRGEIEITTGVSAIETKICTPAELIRRGADKKVVTTITERPHAGKKLVRALTPEQIKEKLK